MLNEVKKHVSQFLINIKIYIITYKSGVSSDCFVELYLDENSIQVQLKLLLVGQITCQGEDRRTYFKE